MSATKKFTVGVLVLCALLAAGVLTFLYATREPSADGRTLTEWLRIAMESSRERDRIDATNAVRKIGVKGIPVLIKKFHMREPRWRLLLKACGLDRFFSKPEVDRAVLDGKEAVAGFSILGPQAAPAIPELSQMLFDTRLYSFPAQALGFIGTPAFPTLQSALTNQDNQIRYRGVLGLGVTSEGAPLAIPAVSAMPKETNQPYAGLALREIARNLSEENAWPLIMEYASHPRWQNDGTWTEALRRNWTNAALGTPWATVLLTNANPQIRHGANVLLIQFSGKPTIFIHAGSNTVVVPRAKN